MYWGEKEGFKLTSNRGKGWLMTVAILSSLGSSAGAPLVGHAATSATTVQQESVSAAAGEAATATDDTTASSESAATESAEDTTTAATEDPVDSSTEESSEADTTTDDSSAEKPSDPADIQTEKPRQRKKESESIDQWMPNKRLQRAVLYQLQNLSPVPDDEPTWNSVADITKEDMKRLKGIYVGALGGEDGESTYNPDGSEYSIEGIEYATNLETVDFGGGGMNDGPQQMFGNLVDISPLAKLPKLTTVLLQNNQIEDISPLAHLKNVTWLDLTFNHISDFSPLKGISYETNEFRFQYLERRTPIVVDGKTRKAHINSGIKLQDGTFAQNPIAKNLITWHYYADEDEDKTFQFYTKGGELTADAEGGLDFSEIKDQEPGITGHGVIPLPDKYYLNAQYVTADGKYAFLLMQPYKLGDVAAPVTVQYHDENGQEVAPDAAPLEGMMGETYTAKPIDIPGYDLVKSPENAQGTFGKDPITVTFTYKKQAVKSTVEVRYQDEAGNKIADSATLTGEVGQPYTTEAANISHYELIETPENATGTYAEEPTTVIYRYRKVEPIATKHKLTIHYQDETGKSLHEDTVLNGEPGETYQTEALSIDGYKLMNTVGQTTGNYGESDLEITYVYAPISTGGDGDGGVTPPTTDPQPPVSPTDPQNPDGGLDPDETPDAENPNEPDPDKPGSEVISGSDGDMVTGEEPDQASSTSSVGPAASLSTYDDATPSHTFGLPQTNEQRTIAAWLGGVLLLGSLWGWWGRRRH
ncbi:MucBP domain-containing protein [Levilactobacillus humaensis]|uniref:MucBP domain-containing protein n=1 Tax=Levilactobacillus humaensis TaxID=2950375 RepID=UPI0021C35718|nr:MucBP domain-containing protein [Levilactobacillus humaensis]